MVAGTIELHRANLASDPAVAKRIRDRARTLFEGVDSAEGRFILAAADAHFDGSKLEGTPPSFLATRSSQAFESSKTHRSTTARLRVANDGRWFELAGNRVDLTRRRALRLLVLALAERHRSNGPGLTQVELLEAGWPGERVDVESGAKRVYTSINLLRTLGLREILTTRDDGYLIRPEIQVSVESHEAS